MPSKRTQRVGSQAASTQPIQAADSSLGDQSKVDNTSVAYDKMRPEWELIGDLMGGTKAMRIAGTKWLPKETGETHAAYNVRVARSTFFNGFKRAVKSLAGKPFTKPVTYAEKLDPKLKDFLLDADMEGRHMDIVLADAFEGALAYGIRYILVDKSEKPPGEQTVADEKANARRPYCVEIDARDLFFWSVEIQQGKHVLTEIRYKEYVTVPDGKYGQKEIMQIRRLVIGAHEIFQKDSKDNWVGQGEIKNDMTYIPLVPIYTGRENFMFARPPLIDLAWENIHHWQSRSDQNHILHVARVPVWFAAGIGATSSEGVKVEVVISPNAMITSDNPDSKLTIVEHTGKAIESGREDLQDSENRMAVLGTELLVNNVEQVTQTATGESIDADANYSQLGLMVRGLENAAETIIEYMADWEGLDTPDEEHVTIFKDFGIAGNINMVNAILQARTAREITQKTFLEEMKRLGALSPQLNVDDEMAQLQLEAPDLGTVDGNKNAQGGNNAGGDNSGAAAGA